MGIFLPRFSFLRKERGIADRLPKLWNSFSPKQKRAPSQEVVGEDVDLDFASSRR